MRVSALPAPAPAFVPFRLEHRPLAIKAGAVLAATAFLAACSWIAVPMIPVPVTMQAFGVTLVAALFGWRGGTLAVLAWLGEAALGLPVLSAGHAGLAYMAGPTAGYLAAFVVVAGLVGWAAEQGWTARGIAAALGIMLAANLTILLGGAAWLSALVGADKAVALGVTPFLLGGLLKAALAATGLEAVQRALPRR